MREKIQQLRDEAEKRCQGADNRHDKDSADAWERIGIALDELQKSLATDFAIVESRRGLFPSQE